MATPVSRRRNHVEFVSGSSSNPLGGDEKKIGPSNKKTQLLHLVVTCTLFVLVVFQFLTRNVVHSEKQVVEEPHAVVPNTVPIAALEAIQHELDAAHQTITDLSEKLDVSQNRQVQMRKEINNPDNDLKRLQSRDKALVGQIKRLQSATQLYSRKLLEFEFGKDTKSAFVQLTLGFPESMGEPSQEDIVIETAPFDVMPTAVYFWLKQVDLGLWDGCTFFRNAHHVIQASSRSPKHEPLHSRFTKANHPASIPFQEYSSKFTHRKYTLGLAGRPGGPDFYVSTVDNVRNHGPGGQGAYDIAEEADSAFGQLITQDGGKSIEVVQRMHTAEVKHGSFKEMKEYVEIVSAKVLRDHSYHSETVV